MGVTCTASSATSPFSGVSKQACRGGANFGLGLPLGSLGFEGSRTVNVCQHGSRMSFLDAVEVLTAHQEKLQDGTKTTKAPMSLRTNRCKEICVQLVEPALQDTSVTQGGTGIRQPCHPTLLSSLLWLVVRSGAIPEVGATASARH